MGWAQQPADEWERHRDQQLEGRKEAPLGPDPGETQPLLDLLSRRGNATMSNLAFGLIWTAAGRAKAPVMFS